MSNSRLVASDANDYFSDFRGLDLQDLLVEVANFAIPYRTNLGLPNDITFGIEVEYEGVLRKVMNEFVENVLNAGKSESSFDTLWISKGDITLRSLRGGGEVTTPIMTDKEENWLEVAKIIDFLKKNTADMSHNAGGHIHVGASPLGSDVEKWRQYLKVYMLYEKVLYRFFLGDKIGPRDSQRGCAVLIARDLYRGLEAINSASSLGDILAILPIRKFQYLNFCNLYDSFARNAINTLEFRGPNASDDKVIYQNNVNVITKMELAVIQRFVDEDFLDYCLREEANEFTNFYFYDLYSEVDFRKGLEFVDIVFDNNFDKVCFLKQYFKNFQKCYCYGGKGAIKAKKMTR